MKIECCILLVLMTFSFLGCQKKHNIEIQTKERPFHFREIGSEELIKTNFPQKWRVHPYQDSFPVSKSDINNESRLNTLDYFDDIKGKEVNNRIYNSLIEERGVRLDSTFVVDSISNKNHSFVYLKSYKTIADHDYDFPPTVHQIDMLIFENNRFINSLNIYTKKSYPFAIDLKIGYFDRDGNLFTKEFKTDEEYTKFVKEEHLKLSDHGVITKQSSRIFEENKENSGKQRAAEELDFVGTYKIYTLAISNSTGKEISLGYFITIKSPTKAILSIDAKYSEDYGCEGDYNLTQEKGILHGRGICDQDDVDDFYIKKENNQLFIKTKRFLNQDWQQLTKD